MIVGNGSQLALKLVRDVMEKDVIAVSDSLKDQVELFDGCFFVENPGESEFIVFMDDSAVERFMPSLLKSNSLIICCNKTPKQRFVNIFGASGYASTASINALEDFKAKLTKAQEKTGLRFIEVLTPSPVEWGYDTSLTVHVAMDAVQAGIWPLYSVEKGRVRLGQRPEKLGVLEPFHSVQPRYRFEKEKVEENWKEIVRMSLK